MSLQIAWSMRFLFVAAIGAITCVLFNSNTENLNAAQQTPPQEVIPAGAAGKQLRYGRDLVARTSYYLGPMGKVKVLSNGMNCQNCHNEAGTKQYALNFYAVAATYPQYMPRTSNVQSIAGRINGCFERSLNGKPLDTTSVEMKAMVAYIKWLGRKVSKGTKPEGTGVMKIAYLDHPADPVKGKAVFALKCQSCHGANGEGMLAADKRTYTFPPLWGAHSYNDGAGLYRITKFAGFVKNNMPFGATYKNPQLTDEEAWNVAAFVNSQPRPHKDQQRDWKDVKKKPIDYPFGPFADQFSEDQHKYGPFQSIEDAQKLITKS